MSDKNIQVGAYGWRYSHWETSFYPDDMPSEWYLSYYSNEFNTVMVPADYWQEDKGFACEEWLDEIHDEFRFYIECPIQVLSDDETFALFLRQLGSLQSYVAGVFLPENVSKQASSERLQRMTQLTRVFGQTGALGNEVQAVWQEGLSENNLSAQLAIFEDDLIQLRRTRVNVEAFVENGLDEQQDIIVKHGTLSASDLMKFRSVIEIMGL